MRHSFIIKVCGAAALIALADWLFYGNEPGWTIGGFALAWTIVLVLASPAVLRTRQALACAALAAFFALVLVEDPNPLAWLLFWLALQSAALLQRRRFDDVLQWSRRLLLHIFAGLARPIADAMRLARQRWREARSVFDAAMMLAVPVIGGILFLTLFAIANPVIGEALGSIRLPVPITLVLHGLLWSFFAFAVWPSLRPHPVATRIEAEQLGLGDMPQLPLASLTLSLIVFNAIFAGQNLLDLIFLWSSASLPGTVTLADYAHRGAYTLIATALLAALFVLIALRPGSESARRPLVRRLVVLWVAQNLLLVASSILRLLDYIGAFSLTVWRIAALLWMLLVAAGLVLVCWRLLRGKSAAWLLNANALAAGLALAAASVVDLGAIAATWNVRHARHVGDGAQDLDLCYLAHLGDASVLPLIELERRVAQPRLRDRVTYLRERAVIRLRDDQAVWHSWTFRNARRLQAAEARLGANPPRPKAAPNGRECDGTPNIPLPPPVPAPAPAPAASGSPLTRSPN